MLKIIKDNKIFLIGYLCFLLPMLVNFWLYPKGASLQLLNYWHNTFADVFFKYATYLGDGIFISLIVLALFAIERHYKKPLELLTIYGMTGIIANLLKKVFDSPRPKLYFQSKAFMQFVPGVDVHLFGSMPSGHTVTAFAVALFFSNFYSKGKSWVQILLLLIAVLVGISRVYLNQHFFEDVAAGSFVGIVLTILIMHLENQYQLRKHNTQQD